MILLQLGCGRHFYFLVFFVRPNSSELPMCSKQQSSGIPTVLLPVANHAMISRLVSRSRAFRYPNSMCCTECKALFGGYIGISPNMHLTFTFHMDRYARYLRSRHQKWPLKHLQWYVSKLGAPRIGFLLKLTSQGRVYMSSRPVILVLHSSTCFFHHLPVGQKYQSPELDRFILKTEQSRCHQR